jgi:hypothetical protein
MRDQPLQAKKSAILHLQPSLFPDKHWDGIAAYCNPKNKVVLGFVEGFNNKIRVIQRRAYGSEIQMQPGKYSCELKGDNFIVENWHQNKNPIQSAELNVEKEKILVKIKYLSKSYSVENKEDEFQCELSNSKTKLNINYYGAKVSPENLEVGNSVQENNVDSLLIQKIDIHAADLSQRYSKSIIEIKQNTTPTAIHPSKQKKSSSSGLLSISQSGEAKTDG